MDAGLETLFFEGEAGKGGKIVGGGGALKEPLVVRTYVLPWYVLSPNGGLWVVGGWATYVYHCVFEDRTAEGRTVDHGLTLCSATIIL